MQNQKKASPSQPEDAEGVVAFGSNVLDSYRYRLSLRNEKLNIWLENRKSKKQWYSYTVLGLYDLVRSGHIVQHIYCFAL